MELKVGRTPALGPLLPGRSDQFGSPAAAALYANVINSSALFRLAFVSQSSEELMSSCRIFN